MSLSILSSSKVAYQLYLCLNFVDNNKSVDLFSIHLLNLCLIILLGLFAVKSASVTPSPPTSPRQAAQDPASLCVTRTHALYAWSSRWRRVDAPGSVSGCLLAPQPRGSRRRMRRPVRATPPTRRHCHNRLNLRSVHPCGQPSLQLSHI